MNPTGECPNCTAKITYLVLVKSGYNTATCKECKTITSYTWLTEVVEELKLNPSLVPSFKIN